MTWVLGFIINPFEPKAATCDWLGRMLIIVEFSDPITVLLEPSEYSTGTSKELAASLNTIELLLANLIAPVVAGFAELLVNAGDTTDVPKYPVLGLVAPLAPIS